MKKKALSVLLALAMVLSLLPGQVLAGSAPDAEQTPENANTEMQNEPEIAPISEPDSGIATIAGDVYTLQCDTELIAGQAVSSVGISIVSPDDASFKSDLSDATLFNLSSIGLTANSVSSLGEGNRSVTLGVTGTLTSAGTYTITVGAGAFEIPPDKEIGVSVTVLPDISVSVTPQSIAEGKTTTFNLTYTGGVFAADAGTHIKVTQGGETLESEVTAVAGTNTATVKLTQAPTSLTGLKITAEKAAFEYQPKDDVSVDITVTQPTGGVTATLVGDLYKGTPITTQTITLELNGDLLFDTAIETADNFTVGDSTGVTVKSVNFTDATHATLSLEGTPTVNGEYAVTIQTGAFKYAPISAIVSGETITIKPAPTGEVTAAITGSLTAGTTVSGVEITLTADGGLKFVEPSNTDNFGLSVEDCAGLSIDRAELKDSKIVLTLKGIPTVGGSLELQ